MALSQAERSANTAAKREKVGEEELRLRVRAGTKVALADLMAWAEVEVQGEALTLMIHHLHGLGPKIAVRLMSPPRHVFEPSESVARIFREKSQLLLAKDPGDEVIAPMNADHFP